MFERGQLVRSKQTGTIYLVIEDVGYYYRAMPMVFASKRKSSIARSINLKKDFDGELIGNNYQPKTKAR